MKKLAITLSVLATAMLIAPAANAYTSADDRRYGSDIQILQNRAEAKVRYNDAVRRRIQRLHAEKYRTALKDEAVTVRMIHNENLKNNFVTQRSTKAKREGALESFDYTRPYAQTNYARLNRSATYLKRRSDDPRNANIGTENLDKGIILGSEHKVDVTSPVNPALVRAVQAETLSPLRAEQRAKLRRNWEEVPSGHQRQSKYWGLDAIKLFHPFMYGTQR